MSVYYYSDNDTIYRRIRTLQAQLQEITRNIQNLGNGPQLLPFQNLQFQIRDNMNAESLVNDDFNTETISRHDQVTNIIKNLESNVYKELEDLIKLICEEKITAWQRSQQLAANGGPFEPSYLNVLQGWCESLYDIIMASLTCINQISAIRNISQEINFGILTNMGLPQNVIELLHQKFYQLMSPLITKTFIVDKQPPQVIMKINAKFSVTLRFLLGSKLNKQTNPIPVTATIVNERQANSILTGIHTNLGSGEILNNVAVMEYNRNTNQSIVFFKNLQIKKITRERKTFESVMDEKLAFYFVSTKFSIGNQVHELWTLSLPITVIVHSNQESHALATIIWDNAFSEPNRQAFVVPNEVPWIVLAKTLNMKFMAETGRGLSPTNLNYLAEKFFRKKFENYETMSAPLLNFNSKKHLLHGKFTFWEWFHDIMKLTKDHLKILWVNGLIHGFVSREETKKMLSCCPSGTFLLRFSDSVRGSITIAWIEEDSYTHMKTISMVEPYSGKELELNKIPDILRDFSHLMYLYPNIPKDKAFGKYYKTQNSSSKGGYVPRTMKPSIVDRKTDTPSMMNSVRCTMQPLSHLNSLVDTSLSTYYSNFSDTISSSSSYPDYPNVAETSSILDSSVSWDEDLDFGMSDGISFGGE